MELHIVKQGTRPPGVELQLMVDGKGMTAEIWPCSLANEVFRLGRTIYLLATGPLQFNAK